MTNAHAASVLLVCADLGLTRRFISELESAGGPRQTSLAASLAQARQILGEQDLRVILFDESSLGQCEGKSLETIVGELTEHAPVVVVAAAHHHESLAFLVRSGAVDLIVRDSDFAPAAAKQVARRARLGAHALFGSPVECEPERDFGELLRHEVNNPLTGILGNAELLLKRRDRLPPHAVARLETIAELAVRLRETIRRLSDCYESRHRSAPLI